MRTAGQLDNESSPLRAHDHVAWCGDGDVEFARLAVRVFATAADDVRLVLVAHLDQLSWNPKQQFADEVAVGRLLLLDVKQTYGPILAGEADADSHQLELYDAVLDEALAAGYRGLCVVADNTSLLGGEAGDAERWLAWEQRTDRWQAERPVTGVCYFDRTQVPADRLARATSLHPLSRGTEPVLRIYHDAQPATVGADALVIDGDVEFGDAPALGAAVRAELDMDLDLGEPLIVELSRLTYMHHSALVELDAASAAADRVLQLRHAPSIVRRMHSLVPATDLVLLD